LKKIILGPFTRTNNSCLVEVVVDKKTVVDARCSGMFFRGFEMILQGKDPRDAGYLTERICGICSSAHSVAAAMALEDAAGVEPPPGVYLLRNLILGADFLQNHIRHIYLFSLPDYIAVPAEVPFMAGYPIDKRLGKKQNDTMIEHLYESIKISRLACDIITLLGGKTPFTHGILAGGSTVKPFTEIVTVIKSKLREINEFLKNKLIPDVLMLAEAYRDYYEIGLRSVRMLEYGGFPLKERGGETYFSAAAVIDGQSENLSIPEIREHLSNSWYAEKSYPLNPSEEETIPMLKKEGAYSWVKAPRYRGLPMEGGPLARLWINGAYRRGVSTMDRTVARAKEAEIIGGLMQQWIEELEPEDPIITPFQIPREAEGIGLTCAMRGPLGHWLRIDKGVIAGYQIITPTSWNFSPRDDYGNKGPVEEALIGTPVADEKQPIEIGRVIRAFDVCASCATHVIVPGLPFKEIPIRS